ncbi:MAG TPA: lipase [Microscillaceae bacterium]|jgi:lysophospholipase L1-like esterase|nr:lipase [Microscillaceae bacterium]
MAFQETYNTFFVSIFLNVWVYGGATLAGFLLAAIGLYVYVFSIIFTKPANRPAVFLSHKASLDSSRKIVACVGDSLTHGNMGVNYVDLLSSRLGDGYAWVNAGINADMSFNLLARIDEIVACQPDYVIILIGTNDVNATLAPQNERTYRMMKGLKQTPTQAWYKENLQKIVQAFQARTQAKIALMSLPVLGEGLEEPSNQKVAQYCTTIQEVANEMQVAYLPLHEKQVAYIQENQLKPAIAYKPGNTLMTLSMIRRYVLGQSWDAVAQAHGLHLTPDLVHTNGVAATMIADLAEEFIRKN